MGTSGTTLVTTACGQTFVSNEILNWGAPTASGGLGEATSAPLSPGQVVDVTAQPTTGAFAGDQIGVTSTMSIERADNTSYAWDQLAYGGEGAWEFPTYIENEMGSNVSINTFAGNFNAPNLQTTSPAYGPQNLQYQFGDQLLGAVATPGSNVGNAQMTFTFAQTLYGLAFQVSSATNPDFIATLDAYDSSGNLIGVYQLNTNQTGVGGVCAGLNDPLPSPNTINPVVCNDAAVIQFYDPEGNIKSVVLTVNDTTGLFIDQLSMDADAPDPGTAPLIGGGLLVLALAAKRLSKARMREDAAACA
jgi:hypothetical protein